jgi:RimJ/RimL family protein N-acetyltransferase
MVSLGIHDGAGPTRNDQMPGSPPSPPLRLALPDPPLTDGRVLLRSWQPADLPALLAGASDPLVHRYRHSLPDGEPAARAWLAAVDDDRRTGTRLELAITAAGDHREALGSVSLWGFHSRNATAMVSYWLAEPGRGRGLAGGGSHSCPRGRSRGADGRGSARTSSSTTSAPAGGC